MINSLTFWGGREPTKTILTPRRMRKRMGEMKRSVLTFRDDILSSRELLFRYYSEKLTPQQYFVRRYKNMFNLEFAI
jgi:hypothetical protein